MRSKMPILMLIVVWNLIACGGNSDDQVKYPDDIPDDGEQVKEDELLGGTISWHVRLTKCGNSVEGATVETIYDFQTLEIPFFRFRDSEDATDDDGIVRMEADIIFPLDVLDESKVCEDLYDNADTICKLATANKWLSHADTLTGIYQIMVAPEAEVIKIALKETIGIALQELFSEKCDQNIYEYNACMDHLKNSKELFLDKLKNIEIPIYYKVLQENSMTDDDEVYITKNEDDEPLMLNFSNEYKLDEISIKCVVEDDGSCSSGAQSVVWKGQEWTCSNGYYDETWNRKIHWEEAKYYCDNLVLNDFTDWRLPSKDELKGLIFCTNGHPVPLEDYKACGSDGYGSNYEHPPLGPSMGAVAYDYYWTGTSYDEDSVWGVSFMNGYTRPISSTAYVRCVR